MYRVNDHGRGWRVVCVMLGRRYSRYFADSHYGSRARSCKVAADYAAHWNRLCEELSALRRRFVVPCVSRTGLVGVTRYERRTGGAPCWIAYWTDPTTGRRVSRQFSVDLHGEDGAREQAIACREQAMRELRVRYEFLLDSLGLRGETDRDRPDVPDQLL